MITVAATPDAHDYGLALAAVLAAGPVHVADWPASGYAVIGEAMPVDLDESLTVEFGLVPGYRPDESRPAAPDVLVVSTSYLGIARARTAYSDLDHHGTVLVVVETPGSALRPDDAAHALGVHGDRVVRLGWDPAIGRAIDAGLLLERPPRPLTAAATKIRTALATTGAVR